MNKENNNVTNREKAIEWWNDQKNKDELLNKYGVSNYQWQIHASDIMTQIYNSEYPSTPVEVENDVTMQQFMDAVTSMVYYSQIHTVTGVKSAGLPTHEEAWRTAQKFLWSKCKLEDDKYVFPSSDKDALIKELVEVIEMELWHEENGEAESQRQGKPRLCERLEILRTILSKAKPLKP